MTGDRPASEAKHTYKRVAESLRAEIDSGDLPAGSQLPTHFELVERFRVSRATIQRALKDLQKAGYVNSEQGRGVFVAGNPGSAVTSSANGVSHRQDSATARSGETVDFVAAIEEAFESDVVTIDAFCLTAESLNGALLMQMQRIMSGQPAPRSIRVRLVLPSPATSLAVPQRVDEPKDERPLDRLRRLTNMHTYGLVNSLKDLRERNYVASVELVVRSVRITPVHKLYVLNGSRGVFGYYRFMERELGVGGGDTIQIYDVHGVDAKLFNLEGEFLEESERWFQSLWETIAQDEEQPLFE
ncbi:GntR family transcriptional regulator [Actinacidiphila soli]|jgi:DNA-binding transcriptional regulator YhcF (GntR family)|uniref:GntR family transcriptional regulator n=1 Tax=Actinacidiphila soli TaxID=2487275 RepID=UPI0013E3C0E0|nr:GntR family transcriptional regulator [Actinacidiphila soli]